jgi:DNA-binding transcriptional MocR family regulator
MAGPDEARIASGIDDPLYVKVARRIEREIRTGVLQAGDRAPSVRSLSRALGVSMTTVLEAYYRLEDRGYLEARPRSGFYACSPLAQALAEPACSSTEPSPSAIATGRLTIEVLRSLTDPGMVPLGAACPAPHLLPARKLNRIVREVLRERPDHSSGYTFPPGAEELRRQIARRSFAYGCSFSPDEIVITSGAMEALNLCLRAVAGPGQLVAIETPTYFGIIQAIESLGMRALEIPAHPGTGIDLGLLKRALSKHPVKACVLMTTCHNPLGSVMSDERKKALVELLAGHELPLVEDDIFADLVYDGPRPKAAKAFDRKGQVLLCSSFSKTLAPGFRVGWVQSGRYRAEVERLKFLTTLASASLPQLAVACFHESGGYDRHLRRLRIALADHVQKATDAIARYFPRGTRVTRPMGGYLLWVELPPPVDAIGLYRRAMAEGISILPGPVFSATGTFRRHIRLSCGYPWSEEMERAFRRLGRLAQSRE